MDVRSFALLATLALLAGCAGEPERARVEPPPAGEWRECPPQASRGIAVPFRVRDTGDAMGRPAGLHRVDARTFLWVYANHTSTLREDRVTRVNPVEVARDADGVVHVCTRVDLVTPVDVDGEARSYAIAVLVAAQDDLPSGPVRVTVNWVAGCPCDPLPRGNTSAVFD